jgi:N-acetylneuraminic acid mutarotase
MKRKTSALILISALLLLTLATQVVSRVNANMYVEGEIPPPSGTKPPTITVFSPENQSDAPLVFNVTSATCPVFENPDYFLFSVPRVYYEGDWMANESFAGYIDTFSLPLNNVSIGMHTVTVRAEQSCFYGGPYVFLIEGSTEVKFRIENTLVSKKVIILEQTQEPNVQSKTETSPTVFEASVTENSWMPKAPMPGAGDGFKAGMMNNKVYVFGSNVTYEYDLYGWATKKPMPTSRGDFALATYQNNIYCIGGRTNSGPEGANEVYDPVSDSWENNTAMPTPRHGLDANVVNGRIYLISGLIPWSDFPNVNIDLYTTYKLTNITEVYDPATDTWTTKTPIPNAVSYYASAVVNGKIYIISETLTQVYDQETDSWSYGASPPFSVDMAGGATVAGVTPQRIYVIGGRLSGWEQSGLQVAYNQVYNPENDSWSLGSPMPTARYGLAVAVANDKIFAIGGLTGVDVSVVQKASNEQYDPLKDKTIPAAPATSPSPQDTPTPESGHEPFPTILVIAAFGASVVLIGIALLIYAKKRSH